MSTTDNSHQAAQQENEVPTRKPSTEEQILAVRVGEVVPLAGSIHIVDYDPQWPRLFEREAARIQAVLGDRMLLIEHVGSTSVPGLAAKPRIDIIDAKTTVVEEILKRAQEAAGEEMLKESYPLSYRRSPNEREFWI